MPIFRRESRPQPFHLSGRFRFPRCERSRWLISTRTLRLGVQMLHSPAGAATILDLDHVIKERHSTRMFLPKQVPRDLVDEAVALAQLAPSNSNIQPWHVVFVSGSPRDRLVTAMLEEAKRRPPSIPPLPESFQHYRRELGAQVYGAMGIPIDDKAGHLAAVMRNWEFFGRRWVALSACIKILVLGRTQGENVSEKVDVGIDRTRSGFLR